MSSSLSSWPFFLDFRPALASLSLLDFGSSVQFLNLAAQVWSLSLRSIHRREGVSKATEPWMSDNPTGLADLVAALDRLSIAITSQPTTRSRAPPSSQGTAEWEFESEDTHPASSLSDLDRRKESLQS